MPKIRFIATHVWAIRRKLECHSKSGKHSFLFWQIEPVILYRDGFPTDREVRYIGTCPVDFDLEGITIECEDGRRVNFKAHWKFSIGCGAPDRGPSEWGDGEFIPLDRNGKTYWTDCDIDHKGPGDDGERPHGRYGSYHSAH